MGEFVNEGACSETADMTLQWGGTAETEKCEESGILLLPPSVPQLFVPLILGSLTSGKVQRSKLQTASHVCVALKSTEPLDQLRDKPALTSNELSILLTSFTYHEMSCALSLL